MKTALILYEVQQLSSLGALLEQWGTQGKSPQIVSLDAEIDYALEKRGIPFISGKTLQNREAPATYLRADEIARTMCNGEKLPFLRYRGISLLDPLRFSIHIYFINFLYYIDIIARLVEQEEGIGRLVVPVPSTPVSKTSSFLATYGVFTVVDAAHNVAESHGIVFEMAQGVPASIRISNKLGKSLFSLKRALFGAGLGVLNTLIAFRPRRAVRILASDYWRNIVPTLRELPEAELVLLDRSEAVKAGFSAIWRHKIRFMHIDHFLSGSARRGSLRYAQECLQKWLPIRTTLWDVADMTFRGVPLAPLCERIMTHLVKRAVPQVICNIEGTYAMYERLSPDAVLLRASVSEQLHFSILPLVAREVDIPALEVQHGGEYLGPGSATRRHAAHFIAAYGPLVCDEFRALGYEEDRLLPVGSPRFDAYIKDAQKAIGRKKESSILTILSNTPTTSIGWQYGTYSIEEYFKTLGDAVRKISNARLLVASRSILQVNEEARARGLAGVDYESAGTTPLSKLFVQADIFVCSYSTVVYEALLYRLPVILAAFAPVAKMMADFHFSHFEKAGALLIAHSPEELTVLLQKLSADPEARARMSKAGWEFMQKNFSFDGHASERIAKLIRNWQRTDGMLN